VLDANGRIVAQADYRKVDAHAAGERSIDRVRIAALGPDAVRLGIAVLPPDAPRALAVDRGVRDQNNRRLLVDLPGR
jgi:hypothetical protein